MKILFLGYENSPLIDFIKSFGDEVIVWTKKIDDEFLNLHNPDFIVSYGYRHIIRGNVLDKYLNKIINLHISYLPWNRGADPNFWSLLEGTPKGVTIHYVDEGIDTGNIIVQKQIEFDKNDTLKTSYEKLHKEIQQLFKENWLKLKSGEFENFKQIGKGSAHKSKDKQKYLFLLEQGLDTPVKKLEEYTKIS